MVEPDARRELREVGHVKVGRRDVGQSLHTCVGLIAALMTGSCNRRLGKGHAPLLRDSLHEPAFGGQQVSSVNALDLGSHVIT